MNEHPTTHALREAFRSLQVSPRPTPNQSLRESVCAFVDEAKLADWPVESVIVAVKHMAVEAGFYPERAMASRTPPRADDLVLTSAVRWCIEHYYSTESSAEPSHIDR